VHWTCPGRPSPVCGVSASSHKAGTSRRCRTGGAWPPAARSQWNWPGQHVQNSSWPSSLSATRLRSGLQPPTHGRPCAAGWRGRQGETLQKLTRAVGGSGVDRRHLRLTFALKLITRSVNTLAQNTKLTRVRKLALKSNSLTSTRS
jgi:hypothetical protein